MDALRSFIEEMKRQGLERGHTLGLFHILIGRQLLQADGTLVSRGLTWREAAALMKKARWPKEAVRDLGLDPATMPPRDRLQFWYAAIAQAHVDTPQARTAGDALAALIAGWGYKVS
jgi:hypothetical protein